MSRTRWLVVIGVTVALLVLLARHQVRQREIARCLKSGGMWDDARSQCVPRPSGPILQRDLYRS